MNLSVDQSGASNAARTPEELAFLHAVECSDITSARRLIAEDPTLNVDVIDALGRTALRLAVRNENRELVELLLEVCSNQNIQQGVLQAISENHTSIAELMLKHPAYLEICRKRQRLGDTDGFFKTEVESQFSTDMTPLNLAAQKNNYTIVQLLLQRGEVIPKPHKFSCSCMECRNRMKFDELRVANFRLNAYRGLASEAYISLSSEDPFLTGFQLAKELRRLSHDEKHFKKQYTDLADQLSDYVVKLLDRVWTQQELSLILDKKGPPDTKRYENLARLRMALENKEKKFVAHPSVQQHLMKIWHRGLHKVETYDWHVRLPCLALLALVHPGLVLAHLLRPDSKWTRLAKQPLAKFLGHIMTYVVFLVLLIISTLESGKRVSKEITLGSRYPDIFQAYTAYRAARGSQEVPYGVDIPLRPHDPSVTEYLITIWVIGMVTQEIQQVLESGVRAHFNDLFNVLDFVLLQGYVGAMTLFFWTMHKSQLALAELEGRNVTMLLLDANRTDQHLYWINTDRTVWSRMDPINLAESLFALANIVSFSRVLNIMPANEALGPLQISLSRMVADFVKFFVFTAIAMGGFIVSLRNLYWWYSGRGSPPSILNDEDAGTSFQDFLTTFRTVFWWIYGRGAWDNALNVPDRYQTVGAVTSEIGKILAGLYHLTIIIVLVNLLIAMMTRTYEKIVDYFVVDDEWKFARTLLYMEYISDGCVAPVPFNLVQLARDAIVMAASWLRAHYRKRREGNFSVRDVSSVRQAAFLNLAFDSTAEDGPAVNGNTRRNTKRPKLRREMTTSSNEDQPTYKDIAQTIVQRYIFDIQREEENSKDSVEEARLNLFHTKWDFLELIEKRDNAVCQLTACLKDAQANLSSGENDKESKLYKKDLSPLNISELREFKKSRQPIEVAVETSAKASSRHKLCPVLSMVLEEEMADEEIEKSQQFQ